STRSCCTRSPTRECWRGCARASPGSTRGCGSACRGWLRARQGGGSPTWPGPPWAAWTPRRRGRGGGAGSRALPPSPPSRGGGGVFSCTNRPASPPTLSPQSGGRGALVVTRKVGGCAMSSAVEVDLIPVRALNQITYCQRLYYLEYVEAVMPTNEHVEDGLF